MRIEVFVLIEVGEDSCCPIHSFFHDTTLPFTIPVTTSPTCRSYTCGCIERAGTAVATCLTSYLSESALKASLVDVVTNVEAFHPLRPGPIEWDAVPAFVI